MQYHTPVLLSEILDFLEPAQGKAFVDATLGDGGHTLELLRRGSRVLGLDYYPKTLERATDRIAHLGLAKTFVGMTANFKDIYEVATSSGFDAVHGVLFDLGYSSSELLEPLGLSFQSDQPLDMRLDSSLGVSAADLVNSLSEAHLTQLFRDFSNERLSRRFAHAIVRARELKKLQTTQDLVRVIESVAPSDYERGRIHPATRVFQALRIVVNDELHNLELALPQAARLLLPGGRMAVISFHSLEDKLVKNFGQSVQPALESVGITLKELTSKPIRPSRQEVEANPRARSAMLRVFERLPL